MLEAEASLALAEAMGEDLEPYLQSPVLYWPVSARLPAAVHPPRLSLGTLQLTLDELGALRASLNPEQRTRGLMLDSLLEAARGRHGSALQRKAQDEQGGRLRLWRAYLDDLAEGGGSRQDYPGEVRNRLIASRLALWAASPAQASAMGEGSAGHDRALRAIFQPGEFVLDERLRSVYPSEEFWYLYGGVKK
ncbi:MAG: hypothetical protein WD906_02825 [Anaerolineales bacterium]